MKITAIIAAAALSLASITPAMAAPAPTANPASALSLSSAARASSDVEGESRLLGGLGSFGTLFAAVAVIAGLVLANAALGDEDQPDSP